MCSRYKLSIPAMLFVLLFIMSGCENYAERTHESWVQPPAGVEYDDSTIYARIALGLNTDPDLQGSDVEVKVEDGKVLLTGTVANQHQFTRINMLSWMVDGVKDVDNQVEVR